MIIQYQCNIGFGFRKHNFVQASEYNFKNKDQKYPSITTKYSKDNKPCVVAFEPNGILIMRLSEKTYYSSKHTPIAQLWYYFDNKNSFIPKDRLTKLVLHQHLLEQHLEIGTAEQHLLFDTTSHLEMSLFAPKEYENMIKFIKNVKEKS